VASANGIPVLLRVKVAAYKIIQVHYDIQDPVLSFAACTLSILQYTYSTSHGSVSMNGKVFRYSDV
jgi:hypothetical protein